ncbi:MAG: transporter [Burkholderiales bacterium]|nr:transporter [Burkholderiales bacterium]
MKNNVRAILLTVAASALLAPQAGAQANDPINTDRPDVVESSAVVGPGRFQIETSFASERNDFEGLRTTTRTTPTLLRYGLSETTELRLETDGFTQRQSSDIASGTSTRTRGFSDVAVGVKWHTHDGDEAKGTPGIAWLLHADLSTGSQEFRGDGVRPSLRMSAEWDLPHDLSLGVMPGLLVDTNSDGHRFVAGLLAVTMSKSWNDAFRTFIEVAGQRLTSDTNGGSVVTCDLGAAYLLTRSTQVDVAIMRGVTRYAPDLLWTVGLSTKF